MFANFKDLGLSPVKAAAASIRELYRLPDNELEQIKLLLIRDAFSHHYDNNAFYRDVCREKSVTPEDILAFEDLVKIPLVSMGMYEGRDEFDKLMSVPANEVEAESRTSGVSGMPRLMRRCANSIDNVLLVSSMMFREFSRTGKGAGLFLYPSTEEISGAGIAQMLNFLGGFFFTHRFMVQGTELACEDAVDQLSEWRNHQFTRHIVAAPFLLERFIDYLKDSGIQLKLDKDSYVITAGGWERFSGEMVSREKLNRELVEYLGVEKTQIRDIYNLAESNAFVIDDEYGEMHVPPVMHFSIRDPERPDRELDPGEPGKLVILDPTMRSTPGFILTEDIARLLPGKSRSGRSGQRMEHIKRIPGLKEYRSCAINLDGMMSKGEGPEGREVNYVGA